MIDSNRPKKTLRRDAFFALKAELEALSRSGDVPPERVAQILSRYDSPAPSKKGGDFGSLILFATTTLGALALGFAAFLVLRYNWAALSGTVKTTIVFGATALAYLGVGVARRRARPVLAETFAFCGAIMFGVDVWQLAQIYQFDVDFPQGAWLWGLGVFSLALFSRLPILHYLAVAVLTVWAGWNFSNISFYYDGADVLWRAGFTAPIFAAVGYFWGVRRRRPSVSELYLLFLAFWAVCQPFVWNRSNAFFFEIFVGGLFWHAGDRLIRNRVVAKTAKTLGAAFVLFSLIPATINDNDIYEYHRRFFANSPLSLFALYDVVLAALAVAAVCAAKRRARRGGVPTSNRSAFWRVAFSPSGIALATVPSFVVCQIVLPELGGEFGDAWRFAASQYANLLSIAVAWFFVCSGAAGRPGRYWSGVLYFILWSLVQYCWLFGDFGGTLGAAGCFAGIALALFVAAFVFQRKIRPLIEGSKAPELDMESLNDADETSRKEANPTVLKIGTLAVVALQFAVLFGVVAVQTARFADAKTILVETAPVDPTSLFRGDYVVLNYPFSNADGSVWRDGENVDVFPVRGELTSDGSLKSRTAFVRLKRDPADDVFKPIEMTPEFPPNVADDEIVLRGRRKGWNRVVYGIEAFFLQEGKGREIEESTPFRGDSKKKALVELLVAANGQARVADVKLVDADD